MPVRVLFVSAMLNQGGAERVVSTLLQGLGRDVADPSLCLLRDDIGYPLPDDVPVHRLGYRGVATFPRTARRLKKLIERMRPEVIVSSVNATNLLTGAAIGKSSWRPGWVARIGNSPRLHDSVIRRIAARRYYPYADRFAVNSRGLAGEVKDCYPFSADRIEVLPNPTDFVGIDEQAREPVEAPAGGPGPVLIAVGRLFAQKRYDLMLRALARVRETVPATLWICGEGPEEHRLRSLARRLGVDSDVHWLGFRANPYALLGRADLFVMTSDHEGLPNSLIEAQGLGLAAVATRCSHGPDEIVDDGKTGLLVAPGDVEAIAGAIKTLLADAPRRSEMGRAAAGLARRRFDARSLMASWEQLLQELARGGGEV